MISRFPACADPLACWLLAGLVGVMPGPLSSSLRAAPTTEPSEPEATEAETPEAPEPPPAYSEPEGDEVPLEVDLADPLAPVDAVLEELESRGFAISDRREVTNLLQGTGLAARIAGPEQALLHYMLEQTAADGYVILLEPAGELEVHMVARPARGGQARGVFFVNVDEISLDGEFLRDDDPRKLGNIIGLERAELLPVLVRERLRTLGYGVRFTPAGRRKLVVEVSPGRSIRRVKVRGHVPLPRREVTRSVGPSARPGALAWGRCVHPRELRKRPAPRICAEDDLACKQWERDEIGRIERFLFDSGYLRGRASLGLSCGRADDEADLWIFLDKGKPYKIRRKHIHVTGNATTNDQRWIEWLFRPKVSPLFPLPKRVSRKHIEEAKEKVEREYAEPRSGAVRVGTGRRGELELPYPGVQVETSYDNLTRENVPENPRLRLEVDVQLRNGVQTAFLGSERIGNNRLRSQLQLFKRREPASAAVARREAEVLRAYYQSRGFLLASVDGKFQEGFGSFKRQQLTFVISEGPRVRMRSLTFLRPEGVPEVVMDRIERKFNHDRKLRRRGRFSDADAIADMRTLLDELHEHGYLCAQVRMRVAFWPSGLDSAGRNAVIDLSPRDETPGRPSWLEEQLDPAGLASLSKASGAHLHVRVEMDPGPRVLTSGRESLGHLEQRIPPTREVEGIPLHARGAWGLPRMLRDGPLRRVGDERAGGIPVTLTLDRDVERDIVQRYRRGGYPIADAELRWVYTTATGEKVRVVQADRLPELGLCREHAGATMATVDTEIVVYEGKRGRFGDALLRGNFKTRKWVLNREIEWDSGDDFAQGEVDRTRAHIDRTGVAESIQIEPQPVACDLGTPGRCEVHEVITMTEAKDRAMDIGFGVGATTLDPLYGALRPSFPNLFGTAWDLSLEGHWGLKSRALQNAFCSSEDCYERSARASLRRRRILASPLDFDVTGQLQRRVTPARGQIDSASGAVRLTWPISQSWRVYLGYLIQIANVSKDLVKPVLGSDTGCGPAGNDPCNVINRGEAIVPDRTGALETGAVWETVDNAFNPHDGIIAEVGFMLASPWLAAWDWWMRADASWMHFIPLPRTNDRLSFQYSLRYGHAVPFSNLPGASTSSIPEVWRYFGGGTVDLGLRGIRPQTMLVDVEEIDTGFGVTTLRPTAQGGHIRALGTVALQVVSLRKFLGGMLAHSLFVDVGVLTQRWRQVRPGRDIRRSIGVNFLKWDIPNMVTMALGYAVLIPDSIIPGGNVSPTDDPNGRVVFDVGVTF